MSSSELTDRTAAVTAALIGLGLRPDDRVLVMLPDGPGFAEVFAGVTRLGAVALPVNPQLSAAEAVAIAAQTGARLVVGSAQRNQRIITDLETASLVVVDGSRGLWAAALRLPRAGGAGTRRQGGGGYPAFRRNCPDVVPKPSHLV